MYIEVDGRLLIRIMTYNLLIYLHSTYISFPANIKSNIYNVPYINCNF